MRQLLVECSDPGIVVSLAEEFENILRQVDFARAQQLQRELQDLARELGAGFEQAWRGFRIEVPKDSGRPLSFGNRDVVDEKMLRQLLSHAAERGIGRFEVRDTLLLPQDGPRPKRANSTSAIWRTVFATSTGTTCTSGRVPPISPTRWWRIASN